MFLFLCFLCFLIDFGWPNDVIQNGRCNLAKVLTRVLYTSDGDPRSQTPTTVVSRDAGGDEQTEGQESPEMEDAGQSPIQDSHFGGPRGRQNPTPFANRAQSAKSSSSSSRLHLNRTLGDMFAATSCPVLAIPLQDTEQCILVDCRPVDVPSSRPGLSHDEERGSSSEDREGPLMEDVGHLAFQESHLNGPRDQQNPMPSDECAPGATSTTCSYQLIPDGTIGDICAATSSPVVALVSPENGYLVIKDHRRLREANSLMLGMSAAWTGRIQTQPVLNTVHGQNETASGRGERRGVTPDSRQTTRRADTSRSRLFGNGQFPFGQLSGENGHFRGGGRVLRNGQRHFGGGTMFGSAAGGGQKSNANSRASRGILRSMPKNYLAPRAHLPACCINCHPFMQSSLRHLLVELDSELGQQETNGSTQNTTRRIMLQNRLRTLVDAMESENCLGETSSVKNCQEEAQSAENCQEEAPSVQNCQEAPSVENCQQRSPPVVTPRQRIQVVISLSTNTPQTHDSSEGPRAPPPEGDLLQPAESRSARVEQDATMATERLSPFEDWEIIHEETHHLTLWTTLSCRHYSAVPL